MNLLKLLAPFVVFLAISAATALAAQSPSGAYYGEEPNTTALVPRQTISVPVGEVVTITWCWDAHEDATAASSTFIPTQTVSGGDSVYFFGDQVYFTLYFIVPAGATTIDVTVHQLDASGVVATNQGSVTVIST